ncbi:hypothetical protein MRO95_22065 [Dickeya dianthicola]|uniref:hypothetical protein n=1 Tax=Dickeya dianthicola TaxID=204039 RepID=UPI001F622F37|nr:hypothetical protein [Dickeya dianthicola]MCI4205330.1 hypothetical protein [Dickeya dianthicola]MCI4214167.1 hypothetical protein [Dickeya dianthicola]
MKPVIPDYDWIIFGVRVSMVQHNGLTYSGTLSDADQLKLGVYQHIAHSFQKKLAITLDDDELSCILEMVKELSMRSIEPQDELL